MCNLSRKYWFYYISKTIPIKMSFLMSEKILSHHYNTRKAKVDSKRVVNLQKYVAFLRSKLTLHYCMPISILYLSYMFVNLYLYYILPHFHQCFLPHGWVVTVGSKYFLLIVISQILRIIYSFNRYFFI